MYARTIEEQTSQAQYLSTIIQWNGRERDREKKIVRARTANKLHRQVLYTLYTYMWECILYNTHTHTHAHSVWAGFVFFASFYRWLFPNATKYRLCEYARMRSSFITIKCQLGTYTVHIEHLSNGKTMIWSSFTILTGISFQNISKTKKEAFVKSTFDFAGANWASCLGLSKPTRCHGNPRHLDNWVLMICYMFLLSIYASQPLTL